MANLGFDTMPAVGINAIVVGQTTQTVKNIDGESVLDFFVDENLWRERTERLSARNET